MINRKLVNDFADLIGNIEIASQFKVYEPFKEKYQEIANKLLKWIKTYYEVENFDFINYDESLKIHEELADIKYQVLPNNDSGLESLLSDNILIRYEVIIKTINNERSNNGER